MQDKTIKPNSEAELLNHFVVRDCPDFQDSHTIHLCGSPSSPKIVELRERYEAQHPVENLPGLMSFKV